MVGQQPEGAPVSKDGRRALRGFLGILTGSSVAQLLAFAALPLLARFYTPSETAHYALLVGVATVLASFASLRLDLAVPIPRLVDDSRRLFWLSVLAPVVVLPVTALIAGGLYLLGAWNTLGLDTIDILAVTAYVVLLTLFTTASQLAIRLRSYGVLSRIPVIQMLGTLFAQLALGAVGFSRGLFVGGLFGRSLGIWGLFRSCGIRLGQIPSRHEAGVLLKRYWRFPAIFAPASLVEVLGSNVPALMFPTLFGFGPAGLFAMAMRVSGVPTAVLSQAASQVFLGEFARATTREVALRVYFRWSAALLAMGLAVASGIWLLAPLILPWLLGEQWTGTAQLAQYAGLMAGAAIVGSPVQHVWTVRQRGLMQFSWNAIRLAASAGVIWFGAQAGYQLSEVVLTLAVTTIAVYSLAWIGCLWAAARPSAGDHLLTADFGVSGHADS